MNNKDLTKLPEEPERDDGPEARPPESNNDSERADYAWLGSRSLLRAPEDSVFDKLDLISAVWLSDAVGTWQWDLRTDKAFWNKRLFELLGLDPAVSEASGKTFFNLILEEDRPRVEAAVVRAIDSDGRFEEEFRVLRPDGEVRWLLARGTAIHDDRAGSSIMLGVNIDISGRKRDESEMQTLNLGLESRLKDASDAVERRSEQLKRLAAQVIHAEQDERKRIANLLHDNVQQTLVAAIFGAEKAKRQIDNASARETLTNVINAIQEVVAKTRLLALQIDPPILEKGTLSEALAWLADSKRERYGLRVAYEGAREIDVMPDVKRFFFETARELLFNIVKHAETSKATMKLERHDRSLCLSISDHGKGCDPNVIRDASTVGEVGLAAIAERVAVLGGTAGFDSAPGAGFRATVTMPIQKDTETR